MATRTLNISLSEDLIKRADRQAKKQQSNRSELMRDALRDYLRKREEWEKIFTYGQQHAKALGLKEEDVDRIMEEVRHGKGKK